MYAPDELSERVGDIIIYKNCFSYSNLQREKQKNQCVSGCLRCSRPTYLTRPLV